MARQQTYGENMAAWEAEQDKRYWDAQLRSALMALDMEKIKDLVKEGLDNGYPVNDYSDNTYVKHFLNQLQ